MKSMQVPQNDKECGLQISCKRIRMLRIFKSRKLGLSLICSKFYRLFLPALPKKLPIILILFSNHYLLLPHYSLALLFQVVTSREAMSYIILKLCCKCPIIPSIMLAKLVTYNSQSYAGTLGSGLKAEVYELMSHAIC